MSGLGAARIPTIEPAGMPRGPVWRERLISRLTNRGKLYLMLALLLLPTVGATVLFTYCPEYASFKYSLYNWDGQETEEFRGFQNFRAIWYDNIFWASFQLTFILLLANLAKMWPSIMTAVVMHRVRSERWQYIYRVLFVIPMIIPGVVALLIWKSFYEPRTGVLDKVLNATGLSHVLHWADVSLPAFALWLTPLKHAIALVFGSPWGLVLVGLMLFTGSAMFRTKWKGYGWWAILATVGFLVWGLAFGQWYHWVIWTALTFRLPRHPGGASAGAAGKAAPALDPRANDGRPASQVVDYAAGPTPASRESAIRQARETEAAWRWWIGMGCIAVAAFVVLGGMTWVKTTHAFDTDQHVWLGHSQLIIPALILWGFPWVGTIGVLLYLGGLQAISQDIYEAAELDGVSSAGRFFRIELPLILTQVRINLVFMTIGTLTDYGLILLLLGPGGGTNSVGRVPGLYAYTRAFIDNEYGYACALGIVMFFIILIITIIYQNLVRIEK